MLGDRNDLGTDWLYFDAGEPKVAADLLASMRSRSGDVTASIEPVVQARQGRLRRRAELPHRITLTPYAEDPDGPGWLGRLTFRPGRPFLQRVGVLPAGGLMRSADGTSAVVRWSLDLESSTLVAAAMEVLRRCVAGAASVDDAPAELGGQWRVMVADLRYAEND